MIQRYSIAPPNALVLLMDAGGDAMEIPESMGGAAIAATKSCVAVGTRNPIDGETEVVLADVPPVAEHKGPPAFKGVLAAPSRRISLETVYGEPLATIEVPTPSVRIRIWTDDPIEPSSIWVAVEEEG